MCLALLLLWDGLLGLLLLRSGLGGLRLDLAGRRILWIFLGHSWNYRNENQCESNRQNFFHGFFLVAAPTAG